MSVYLFGTEEHKGLSSENVSASWIRSKVNILFIQTGFINLRDETKKNNKWLRCLDTTFDVHLIISLKLFTLQWVVLYLSASGGANFCCAALLNSEKNSGFTMGRQQSRAEIVWKKKKKKQVNTNSGSLT